MIRTATLAALALLIPAATVLAFPSDDQARKSETSSAAGCRKTARLPARSTRPASACAATGLACLTLSLVLVIHRRAG